MFKYIPYNGKLNTDWIQLKYQLQVSTCIQAESCHYLL